MLGRQPFALPNCNNDDVVVLESVAAPNSEPKIVAQFQQAFLTVAWPKSSPAPSATCPSAAKRLSELKVGYSTNWLHHADFSLSALGGHQTDFVSAPVVEQERIYRHAACHVRPILLNGSKRDGAGPSTLSHQAGLFMDMAVKHTGVDASRQPIEGHEKFSFVLDQQSA